MADRKIKSINSQINSTTKVDGGTDRSLISKRVRALLNDEEGSELLFEAILNERKASKGSVHASNGLIEKLERELGE